MEVINVYQAKTNLSHLLDLVQKGQRLVIGKAGKPIADLVPHQKQTLKPRKPGALAGKIKIGPEFDEADKEIEKLFYDSKIFPA